MPAEQPSQYGQQPCAVEGPERRGRVLEFHARRVDELAVDICHKMGCLRSPTPLSSRCSNDTLCIMADFEQCMARLIGKRALVGITYVKPDGERRIQMHGVISRGVENVGIYLRTGDEEFRCRGIRTPFIQRNRADMR